MNNPPLNGIEPIAQLLPLRSVVVTLEVIQPIQFSFLHHVPLHAWMRNLCDSPDGFSDGFSVQPLENGHTQYRVGDFYRFKLTATTHGAGMLQRALEQLCALPESAKTLPGSAILHQNLRLHRMQCLFSGSEVFHIDECAAFDLDTLAEHVEFWQNQQQCLFRCTTPIRLKNEAVDKKGKQRYCRDKQDFTATLLAQRINDTFITLLQNGTNTRYSRAEWPDYSLITDISFWVEHHYGNNGNINHEKKNMGGALFCAQLQGLNNVPRWCVALLVLGQLIGIGQSRAFGLGQYVLLTKEGTPHIPQVSAAHALLHQSLSETRITDAFNEACRSEYTEEQKTQALTRLRKQCANILNSTFAAPTLQQVDIEKDGGGTRTLSIPPWQDRIVQKAVASMLSASLDQLWKQQSYGYRKGRSRFNAKDAINNYIRQGYEWALESDVEGFFDNVCWHNLEARLALLFPTEPLVELLMLWIKAPIRTPEGEEIPRTKGLPQGSPISPLLANLILDDFDGDMLALDYKLVRYADDFVLLFKSKAQAQQAMANVIASLNEHGLDIKQCKTHIIEAKKGFRYLGFLFIDGYAVETSAAYREEAKEFEQAYPGHFRELARIKDIEQQHIGERQNLGTFLVISGEISFLSCQNNKLKVTQDDKERHFSWQELESILLLGPHNITTPAQREAMRHGIPIHFASRYGQYQGVTCANQPVQGHQVWLLQAAQFQRPESAITFSKAVVLARIEGQTALISRRSPSWPELIKLQRIKQKVRRAATAESLLGHEGEAAKLLWKYFKETLPEEWQFNGRNKRPPKDPVNAMLSLGYTYLYHLTDTMNQVVGLCSWLGFYHQNHGAHRTLASDMMEPLRVIVERVVLTLINKKQIKPDDFSVHENGCEMTTVARKKVLSALLIELTCTRPKKESRLLDDILKQSRDLKIAIKLNAVFTPWTPR